jgi:Winged helix DNA-binding domain
VKREDIARRRMANHHLWGHPFQSPVDVIHHLGAVQAQDFGIAKWSVAQRARGISNSGMDELFSDGAVLRTHLLRPTWHFVLPSEIRWMLDLTAPRVHSMNAPYYRRFGLDDELFAKTNVLLARTLRGGRQLTRREISEVLTRKGITASGLQLGYILMRAELDALICSGALKGKQQTYALFDERVPETEVLDRDEALAELTRRYFTARGPATVKDYVWWSSLTTHDARSGIQMIESELRSDSIDGRQYWFATSSRRPRVTATAIDLVQGLDECIVSYSESKDVLHESASSSTWGTGGFTHAILLDGRIVGHWRRVREQSSIIVETSFYGSLDRGEARALKEAVDRYGRFMGVPTALV